MRNCRIILCMGIVFLFTHCATVPITGRKQLLIMPESEIVQMSLTSYDSFLKENKLSKDAVTTLRVKNVGKRIANAVETYLRSQGLEAEIADFNWEFNLVESKEINAWCMPGGKVVFYEGIIPICRNDAGIAVVMGHEIAHAVAHHGNERMSQEMLVKAGSAAAALAMKNKPRETQALLEAAIGLGTNYGVVLPFSRKHEYEADHLGLIFMTIAGYDPQEAVDFWTRMAAATAGQKAPQFMSTHPSDANRIAKIKQMIPEALQYKKISLK